MPTPSDTVELTPAVIADLVARMEVELPVATDLEHRMALDIARMRLLEGAVAIGELAQARPAQDAAA
jgi:hypothetical protein